MGEATCGERSSWVLAMALLCSAWRAIADAQPGSALHTAGP
jgi:hypothetical protein